VGVHPNFRRKARTSWHRADSPIEEVICFHERFRRAQELCGVFQTAFFKAEYQFDF